MIETAAPPLLSRRQCGSRRAFTVSVRRQFRKRARSATVRVDGKRVATLRRGKLSKRISLKGRTRSTLTVPLVMRLKDGR